MARYEFILGLDGALWLRIISKPLLTPKTAMEGPKIQKESKIDASCGSGAHPYQNPLYEQKVGPHMSWTMGDATNYRWGAVALRLALLSGSFERLLLVHVFVVSIHLIFQ